MRKNSSDKSSVLSTDLYLRIQRQSSSMNTTEPRNTSSFQQYPDQSTKTPQPIVKFRVKRASNHRNDVFGQPGLNQQIKKAKQELASLKKQLAHQRSHTETVSNQKIDMLISFMKNSHSQRQPPSPPQQIYFPIPMPYPYIMPTSNLQNQPSLNQTRNSQKSIKYDTRNLIRNKLKDKQLLAIRVKKNIKRWKKVGNCILFILYLKRYCKLFQKDRKLLFLKFFKKNQQITDLICKNIKQKMQPLYRLLKLSQGIKFQIQQDEKKEIIRQKVQSIKKIIKMVLQNMLSVVTNNQAQIIEFCYFFCKHGNYSCTQPLMTEEQLELSCISNSFQYISAQKNLQKTAIINLLIIKILITNIFLSPFQSNSTQIQNNLFFISSVIYEFSIKIQDEYLLKVPKSYKIGNFQGMQFVKMRDSIIVNGSKHRPGQLISGLSNQLLVDRYLNFKQWIQEKKIMIQLINKVSEQMKKLHMKISSKYY